MKESEGGSELILTLLEGGTYLIFPLVKLILGPPLPDNYCTVPYHFDLGWVRGWYSGKFFQVTGIIDVCLFSWFEIFRSEIFWDKPFLAVNLF